MGGLIFLCSYSFWRWSNYFLSSWRVTVLDPGGINIFLFMQFSPLCGLSCLHFYQEWNFQPLWKVKRLEQFTSWKVRVPDCVFLWKIWTPICAYTHTHTQLCTHTFIHKNTCTKTSAITRLSGWLCGGVVWCGVVRCVVVVVSLSLVFSNLKLVRSKGFFRWTSEARDNLMWTIFGKQNCR